MKTYPYQSVQVAERISDGYECHITALAGAAVPSSRLPRPLTRALGRWRQARAQRATERALMALDDHTLKDIGVNRSAIVSLAHELHQPRAVRVMAPMKRGSVGTLATIETQVA
ncbi:MAG: DUF1127 domain-containing protein [Gammaproteobacteria bacterium]